MHVKPWLCRSVAVPLKTIATFINPVSWPQCIEFSLMEWTKKTELLNRVIKCMCRRYKKGRIVRPILKTFLREGRQIKDDNIVPKRKDYYI